MPQLPTDLRTALACEIVARIPDSVIREWARRNGHCPGDVARLTEDTRNAYREAWLRAEAR